MSTECIHPETEILSQCCDWPGSVFEGRCGRCKENALFQRVCVACRETVEEAK